MISTSITMPSMTVISEEVSKGKQCWDYVKLLKVERRIVPGQIHTRKLRISIKSDSYDFQSRARIEMWAGDNGWVFVHCIPFANMKSLGKFQLVDFQEDAKVLLNVALEIIF